MISRRQLLKTSAAFAAVMSSPALAAMPKAKSTPLKSYSVGVDGEWNWAAVKARNPTEAIQWWCSEEGVGSTCEVTDGDMQDDCDCEFCEMSRMAIVERQESWDGIRVKPGDEHWLAVGLGATCTICKIETSIADGAKAIGRKPYCSHCAPEARMAVDCTDQKMMA